ncbi:hypothetical protein F5B22DRAFT_610210 [Xylaria bambusicola]|uniref:uncharacterized protein n=1 Tax=Xylaria bambusicola TaxID=326684 RepID=UPI0020077E11|nr:uncharacterized protein F5B22DRAFT_610210 [Xylaria bambusicola]KAI0514631.1 hypothetical protein F5B22DRAFT_610210 [Xylaria bambusicola]
MPLFIHIPNYPSANILSAKYDREIKSSQKRFKDGLFRMRLLKTSPQDGGKLVSVEKNPNEMIGLRYAILSHTRGKDELVYEDIIYGIEEIKSKTSRNKVRMVSDIAAQEDNEYIWIDTCCIDKSSSGERSSVCHVCSAVMIEVLSRRHRCGENQALSAGL